MRLKLVLFLAAILLLAYSASAGVSFTNQPNSVYSINDLLKVIISTTGTGDLQVNLVCDSGSKVIFLPSSINNSQESKVYSRYLINSYLDGIKGNCILEANFNSEKSSSYPFKISDSIETIVNINPTSVKPGENINIKGTAVKENSQNLEGFVELKIDAAGIDVVNSVKAGEIEANLSLPENLKAGEYKLEIITYDEFQDEIANYDKKEIILNLIQEPKKIDIAADKQSIVPGESIKIKPTIYDQANEEVQGDIKLEIIDADGRVYFSKLLKTGEEELKLPENASIGYWKIQASYLGLTSQRLLYVEALQKAKFEVINDTLIITNVGNSVYRKSVQIAIGNEVEIKELELKAGEIKRFKLLAPDGNYKVSVSDGQEALTQNDMSLTGNVIGIADINKQISLFNKYPIVWLFLIVVFGLFILMMTERVVKRKFYGFASDKKENKAVEKKQEAKISVKDFSITQDVRRAEHSLVMNGKKEEASVVVVKIKNPEVMKNSLAKENIEKAVEKINRGKGSLYRTGENIMGIFTPSLTKTFKNDLLAVKTASEIASHLNEHNKKFKDKIEFGIGIHSGDIAANVEKGKLKFTALGNTLSLAKKVADTAKNEVLLSNDSNKKVMSEVKTEKLGEFHSIKRIVDREQHKAFLDNFLKRN